MAIVAGDGKHAGRIHEVGLAQRGIFVHKQCVGIVFPPCFQCKEVTFHKHKRVARLAQLSDHVAV